VDSLESPPLPRQDFSGFIIASCGFATSFLTAGLLWWIERKTGFGFYSLLFLLIIPGGAIISGFAAAFGYYIGAWIVGRRPARMLLVNIVLASLSTYFLIHYLSYRTEKAEGRPINELVSFPQYVDAAIRSLEFRHRSSGIDVPPTRLREWGYGIAALQVLGFACGGFLVYAHLKSMPYCNACSRYLSHKAESIRYAGSSEAIHGVMASVGDKIQSHEFQEAIAIHRESGSPVKLKSTRLRIVCRVRRCKKCDQHWIKFAVERYDGHNWLRVPELEIAAFMEKAIDV
jgi:hypothetical protein